MDFDDILEDGGFGEFGDDNNDATQGGRPDLELFGLNT